MRQTFDETTDPSFGAKHLPLLRAEMAKQGLDGFLQSSRIRPDTPSFTNLIHFVSRQIWQFGFLFLPLLP